jgi:hypothetical protein
MRETSVTLPELAMVAGTRAAIGAGLGFLLADRFSDGSRRAIGWTLLLFGALSTIPLAFEILGKMHSSIPDWQVENGGRPRVESNDRPFQEVAAVRP